MLRICCFRGNVKLFKYSEGNYQHSNLHGLEMQRALEAGGRIFVCEPGITNFMPDIIWGKRPYKTKTESSYIEHLFQQLETV